MLLAPRRSLLIRLLARLGAVLSRDAVAPAADLRYLDRLAEERLGRDLGLRRTADRRYRSY